ncbi:MAG: hypothetical protein OXB96_01715 [Candidatus Kaiserbacteria bacterium]|nr:hypothetical protein [Candidatus Kaiserbacteria bacterium]
MRSFTITPEKFFDKAHKIAGLYGFGPINEVFKDYRRMKRTKITMHKKPTEAHLQHLSLILRFYFERALHTYEYEPMFLFHSNVDKDTKSAVTRSKKPGDTYFTLTVVGVRDSYAEALLLSCASHIFRSLKSDAYRIRINSMGTADDSKLYFSKLAKTLRKVKKNIDPACQKLLGEDRVCEVHPRLYAPEHVGVSEYITPTLRLLSEKARQHFERVIEYLEAHQLPYELAPDVVELTRYGIHTAFEINDEHSPLYARGARYDTLPYHLYRRKIPTTSITITLPEKAVGTHQPKSRPRKPKAFFFHTGETARLRSLGVISQLYEANIPVAHRLHYTRVADQLNDEARSYPYTIVFGQEEAENNVICIRKTDTRASRMVDLTEESLQTAREFLKK